MINLVKPQFSGLNLDRRQNYSVGSERRTGRSGLSGAPAPDARHTPQGPPPACTARGSAGAGMGDRGIPGRDGRRSHHRSARTRRCGGSCAHARSRPTAAAGLLSCRGRAGPAGEVSQHRPRQCAATGHRHDALRAVPGRRSDEQETQYRSRRPGLQHHSCKHHPRPAVHATAGVWSSPIVRHPCYPQSPSSDSSGEPDRMQAPSWSAHALR
jgi:hypothetical protein